MLFTMTCSSNNTQNALLCFQYGLLRYRYTGCPVLPVGRLKYRAAPDSVRLGRDLNLSGASWRDSSEHIKRLINLLV